VVPVGLKPVIVPDASFTPTFPVTTDVPVLEIVPPSSPKELAVPRSTEMGAAKAVPATVTAIAHQTSPECMRPLTLNIVYKHECTRILLI
jgi:hypothetical protein